MRLKAFIFYSKVLLLMYWVFNLWASGLFSPLILPFLDIPGKVSSQGDIFLAE